MGRLLLSQMRLLDRLRNADGPGIKVVGRSQSVARALEKMGLVECYCSSPVGVSPTQYARLTAKGERVADCVARFFCARTEAKEAANALSLALKNVDSLAQIRLWEPDQPSDDLPVIYHETKHPDPVRVARRFLRRLNYHYAAPGGVWPAFIRAEVYQPGVGTTVIRERRDGRSVRHSEVCDA